MPRFMHTKAAHASPEHYAELRRAQRRRYYAATANIHPPRRWEEWEDELVLAKARSDRELSELLQRSMKSISNRRWRLRSQGASPDGEGDCS